MREWLVQYGLVAFLAHIPLRRRVHAVSESGGIHWIQRLLDEVTFSHAECLDEVPLQVILDAVIKVQRIQYSLITHRLDSLWWLFKAGEGGG